MNVLYIGDIMAVPGHTVLQKVLPGIKQEYDIDFTIAQAENSNPNGKGPGWTELKAMQAVGVDFFSGGNHSLTGSESSELYSDPAAPIVRPANLRNAAGSGYKIVETSQGNLLIASMLGQTVGKHLDIDNPLLCVDTILEETKDLNLVGRIINLHGDFSSEKRVFGYYLDGKFSAVIGDHWHVPTADAMVMPKGTAHITDVGMCGTLHSSLGVTTQVIIDRWKTNQASKNVIETDGPLQFNAVVVNIDTETSLARSIQQVQRVVNQ